MSKPPIILRYPAARLLPGLIGSGLVAYIGLLLLLGSSRIAWVGAIALGLGVAGLLRFGCVLVARERFGSLRIDADGLVYRFGFRTRRARFLDSGPFHRVDYIGPDFLTWRRLEAERALSAEQRRRAPDPSDDGTEYLQPPDAMVSGIGGLQALCDLLNRRRRAAFEQAGLSADIAPAPIPSNPIARRQPRGFPAPPAIPRSLFLALYMFGNPIIVISMFVFYEELVTALARACAAILGAGSGVIPLLTFGTAPAILLLLGLWNTWLAAGRLKDLGEEAGFWRAFRHAVLSSEMRRRKLIFRRGGQA